MFLWSPYFKRPAARVDDIISLLLSRPKPFSFYTVNPLLSPPGRGSLFNLETTMASVHHKELEYKAEKLKRKKVGGHADEPVIEPIY